jgi:F-type H+-transporting ATPase subunit epsilon
MPHAKFPVEILTPEGEVFNEEVEMVSTRTTVGVIGILANHSPLLATLEPTELKLYRSDTEILRFAQAEGYLQVADNRAMLLVQEAVSPESLDVADLRTRLGEAEATLAASDAGSEKYRQAAREQKRLTAFIAVAESA